MPGVFDVSPLPSLPRSPFSRRYIEQWAAALRRRPSSVIFLLPWALSRRANHSAISDEVPWIPFRAVRWLEQRLRPDMRAFEWGSGGSTLFLAKRLSELVSVEHDPTWHAVVAERIRAGGHSNCKYRLIPPSPARPEGTPFGSGQRGSTHLDFESYVRAIEVHPDGYFDLIMIDGRARMACLSAAWSKVRVGGLILLDNSNYDRYQPHLEGPSGFDRTDIADVSPYGGEVWTQSTIWRRAK